MPFVADKSVPVTYQAPLPRRLLAVVLLERLAYFSVRATLMLYLVEQLRLPKAGASATYGFLTLLAYILPPLGACLVDCGLGAARSLRLGGLLLAVATTGLAVTAGLGAAPEGLPPLFLALLSLTVAASGLLRPATNAVLGHFARGQDERALPVFFWAQLATGLGALLAPLLAGQAQDDYGIWTGFGISAAAAVALVLVGWNSTARLPDLPYSTPGQSSRWPGLAAVAGLAAVVVAMHWGHTLGARGVAPILCIEAALLVFSLWLDPRNRPAEPGLQVVLAFFGLLGTTLMASVLLSGWLQTAASTGPGFNPAIPTALSVPLVLLGWYGLRRWQRFTPRFPGPLFAVGGAGALLGGALAFALRWAPGIWPAGSTSVAVFFGLLLFTFFEASSGLLVPAWVARRLPPHLLARGLALLYLLFPLAYQMAEALVE